MNVVSHRRQRKFDVPFIGLFLLLAKDWLDRNCQMRNIQLSVAFYIVSTYREVLLFFQYDPLSVV